jgi:hypothetical protein
MVPTWAWTKWGCLQQEDPKLTNINVREGRMESASPPPPPNPSNTRVATFSCSSPFLFFPSHGTKISKEYHALLLSFCRWIGSRPHPSRYSRFRRSLRPFYTGWRKTKRVKIMVLSSNSCSLVPSSIYLKEFLIYFLQLKKSKFSFS